MAGSNNEIGRRVVSGIRWVLLMNLATLPLSFLTNLLLGRISSRALGAYSAIQVFAEGFQATLLFGGANVFTRFIPALPLPRRWSFVATYTLLVSAIASSAIASAVFGFPATMRVLLDRFGRPGTGIAVSLCLAVLVWAFSSFFLYGTLDAKAAAITLRTVVVGYFVASVVGVGAARGLLARDPSAFLWPASVVIYGAAALVGVVAVLRTDEFKARESIRWGLPTGFWEAAIFTHLQTLVSFAYTSLAPSVVLFWTNLESLGFLHAALRFPVLVSVVPVMMASVIGPAVSAQASAGRRTDAFRQAGKALDAAWAAVVPVCVVLGLFAGDAMRVFGPAYPAHRDLLRVLALTPIAAPMVFIGASIAVALHAFRDYFVASLLFLLTTLGLSVVLVPRWGTMGAATAMVAGSIVQHAAVTALLRIRFDFRTSSRAVWAWLWPVCGSVAGLAWDPGRLGASALAVALIGGFVWTANVRWEEVRSAIGRMLGRD